jgi:hypothetical protein
MHKRVEFTRPANATLSAPAWPVSDTPPTATVRVQARRRALCAVRATHTRLPSVVASRPEVFCEKASVQSWQDAIAACLEKRAES